jgi:hypothetical protein
MEQRLSKILFQLAVTALLAVALVAQIVRPPRPPRPGDAAISGLRKSPSRTTRIISLAGNAVGLAVAIYVTGKTLIEREKVGGGEGG